MKVNFLIFQRVKKMQISTSRKFKKILIFYMFNLLNFNFDILIKSFFFVLK